MRPERRPPLPNQCRFQSLIFMIEFFPPNARALLPTFRTNCQMPVGLILPRWGLILPRIPPQTPILYSAVTHPFRRLCVHKTPPSPPQNTPFPGLNLKVGKMNYRLGNLDPNWENV